MHRVPRAGRPRIYCTNACRQRAYRWRRDNLACTRATATCPVETSFATHGRFHALRTSHDYMSTIHDHLNREISVCGALVRPTRALRGRAHHNFPPNRGSSCLTCSKIVTGQPVRISDPPLQLAPVAGSD
jgi:hypothetical protein